MHSCVFWCEFIDSVVFLPGSKGWRSGESARLPPMWPGFKSRRRRHTWVEFVVGSLLCSERFFSGYSGFPLSSETSISKFQFDQESGRRRTTLWMCYLQIIIYLFIYGCFVSLVNTKFVAKITAFESLFYCVTSFQSDSQKKSTHIFISWQELKNKFLSFFVHR